MCHAPNDGCMESPSLVQPPALSLSYRTCSSFKLLDYCTEHITIGAYSKLVYLVPDTNYTHVHIVCTQLRT